MTEWERVELRPLFTKLIESANEWEPPKVLPRTKQLGSLLEPQLNEYSDGKFRLDRNESLGFFEAIDRFADTGLPLSLDHFNDLVNQYRDRITPYPHYSGIKVIIPKDFDDLDHLNSGDVPEKVDDDDDDEDDSNSTLTLM